MHMTRSWGIVYQVHVMSKYGAAKIIYIYFLITDNFIALIAVNNSLGIQLLHSC
jgi:hypothetical protein